MHTKLNPEFKARLCTTLRSGEYTQETGGLRSTSGYCCLGVAADLSGCTWELAQQGDSEYKIVNAGLFYLPPHLVEGTIDGNFRFPEEARSEYVTALQSVNDRLALSCDIMTASYLNDNKVPFTVIADLIERWL